MTPSGLGVEPTALPNCLTQPGALFRQEAQQRPYPTENSPSTAANRWKPLLTREPSQQLCSTAEHTQQPMDGEANPAALPNFKAQSVSPSDHRTQWRLRSYPRTLPAVLSEQSPARSTTCQGAEPETPPTKPGVMAEPSSELCPIMESNQGTTLPRNTASDSA